MKGLIFCAGLGTRLHPMTLTQPKCMINIGGKPVLEHIIDHLNNNGITEIIVNVHWLYPQIMEYFGTRLIYSYEQELLGEKKTEEGLKSWLGDKYVVCNGDTLTNIDINKMLEIVKPDTQLLHWDEHKNVYAGTKVVFGIPTRDDYYIDTKYWVDMGTPEGLAKARELYDRN